LLLWTGRSRMALVLPYKPRNTHLGKVEDSQKLFEIRVGGIYALERIARESEKDHWPIMEILSAYVRQNAPLPPEAAQERMEDATDERRALEGSRGKSEPTEPSAPDSDIQAIMTILRRRSRSYGKGEPEPLDLRETNLTGANLSGADLSGAQHLTQKQLEQAEGDKNTKLPSDLNPPSTWDVKTDEQSEGE
jgi:Pentapeptide repeats (8 copies)